MAHTIFGLLFIGFAIFHVTNNWGSIKSYSKDRVSSVWRKELLFAFAGALVILTLALTEVLEPVAEFGRVFAPKREGSQAVSFQEKKTLETGSGKAATLILQRKKSDAFTPIKVELADSTGKIISTLFEDNKAVPGKDEEKRPMANLIIDTKIDTSVPFRIIISTEKSKHETIIYSQGVGIQAFQKSDQSPLLRGMIEFN